MTQNTKPYIAHTKHQNMSFQITPVSAAQHYQAISTLMDGLHQHERQYNPRTALWSDIETSYMRHVINMQEECDGICLLATVNGQPAGFIFGYLEHPDDSDYELNPSPELYVSDGFVSPAYRRLGIYTALNRQLEAHFIPMGIRRITRFTLTTNSAMQQFLQLQGYQATRLLYEKWL